MPRRDARRERQKSSTRFSSLQPGTEELDVSHRLFRQPRGSISGWPRRCVRGRRQHGPEKRLVAD